MSTTLGELSLPQARQYVKRAHKGLEVIFKDFNMNETQSTIMARNVWGDLPPETIIYGYDGDDHNLGHEHFGTEVLDTIAKALNPIAEKKGDEVVQKAITTTSATYFIPVFIDPRLVDIVKRETPYLAILPKKTMAGATVNVPRRTAGITPIFKADGTTAITVSDQTYNDINVNVRYLYAAGQLTNPSLKTTEATLNLKQANIEHTFMDLMRNKESFLLRGRNAAGTETWNGFLTNDTNAYDGLFKRIHEDASGNENQLNNTAPIALNHVDTMIENVISNGGIPDFGVCDLATATSLMQTARSYQRLQENQINLGAPIGRIQINGVPIFATTQIPRISGSKGIVICDNRCAELRTLLPDEFVEAAQDMTDTYRYFWRVYETMVIPAAEWASSVTGGT